MASLVAIGSTQHLTITLDPGATAGAPEIIYVTAHTASATTATILRGQEGTTARSHAQNTPWVHGATARDFTPTAWTTATLTSPWTAYTTTGYPPAPAYSRDSAGVVRVRGLVTSGTTGGSAILTLPAGYRPAFKTTLQGAAYNGTAWGVAYPVLEVAGTGVITIVAPAPSSSWVVGLDNIMFLAEA